MNSSFSSVLSYEPTPLVLAPGEVKNVSVSGDFVFVYAATAPFQMSVNGSNVFAPTSVGASFQGQEGSGQLSNVSIKNTSGAQNSILLVSGKGRFVNPANVAILNPTFNLSAGDKNDIRGLPEVLTPAAYKSTANTVIAAGKRSISIYNSGAANITVAGMVMAPGESVAWSVPGRFDTLAAVTCNAAGSEATVTTLT